MKWQLATAEHYPWLAERAGITVGPLLRAIEVVDDKGEIKGMVGYDGWTPNLVCMHVALEAPMAIRALPGSEDSSPFAGRRFINAAFGIAFMRRNVVIGQVIATNRKALELDLHLGFREIGRIRDGWQPGIDLIVLEMRREECRWIPVELRERRAA